ncbi:hypothetical protein HDU91_005005, partial [Kappamyces sp. JEL0680]
MTATNSNSTENISAMGTSDAPASRFNETLSTVTAVKLRSLALQRQRIHAHFTEARTTATAAPSEIERLRVLVNGIVNCPVPGVFDESIDISSIQDLLEQAEGDASVGPRLMAISSTAVLDAIRHLENKYDHAFMFGKILTDWLQSDAGQQAVAADASVGRKEKFETQQKLEEIIFEPATADVAAYRAYLNDLFKVAEEPLASESAAAAKARYIQSKRGSGRGRSGHRWDRTPTTPAQWVAFPADLPGDQEEKNRLLRNTLTTMRDEISKFGLELWHETIVTAEDIVATIRSLLKEDLLDNAARKTCKEVKSSKATVAEIASVINILLRDLPMWSWPENGVRMVLRRVLNGKYRCFLDEDIITAIFLHYVGTEWAIKFKAVFTDVVNSHVWNRSTESIADNAKLSQLHKHMIPENHDLGRNTGYPSSFAYKMGTMFRNQFFMTMLPSDRDHRTGYDEDNSGNRQGAISGAQLKQLMLQKVMLASDASRVLHPTASSFTVVQADLQWFGPSLSHDILLESLRFTGMDETWIRFIRNFLQVPSKFRDTDDPRIRRRGVPISHMLSTLLGEVMLFFMEFAVNQRTGIELIRLHDDFWFFDQKSERCLETWSVMQHFARLTGLVFNSEKCGSCRILGKDASSGTAGAGTEALFGAEPLPQARVKWGFISLLSNGTFHIDQTSVDEHIVEMKRQITAAHSALGVINAYNR